MRSNRTAPVPNTCIRIKRKSSPFTSTSVFVPLSGRFPDAVLASIVRLALDRPSVRPAVPSQPQRDSACPARYQTLGPSRCLRSSSLTLMDRVAVFFASPPCGHYRTFGTQTHRRINGVGFQTDPLPNRRYCPESPKSGHLTSQKRTLGGSGRNAQRELAWSPIQGELCRNSICRIRAFSRRWECIA